MHNLEFERQAANVRINLAADFNADDIEALIAKASDTRELQKLIGIKRGSPLFRSLIGREPGPLGMPPTKMPANYIPNPDYAAAPDAQIHFHPGATAPAMFEGQSVESLKCNGCEPGSTSDNVKPCNQPAKWRGLGQISYRLFCDECLAATRAYERAEGLAERPVEKIETAPAAQNFAMSFQPTFWQRVGRWLFPRRHVEAPEIKFEPVIGDPPGIKGDTYFCTVKIKISWLDLFRLFVSRRATCKVIVVTQYPIGEHHTATGFTVEPPECLAIEKWGPLP